MHEKPAILNGAKPAALPASIAIPAAIKVTHPDRIIDPSTNTTKIQLIEYYSRVAPLMMEHLKNRPVSIVRAPQGITGQLFFQKHNENAMPGIAQLDPALDPDHQALLEVVMTCLVGVRCSRLLSRRFALTNESGRLESVDERHLTVH